MINKNLIQESLDLSLKFVSTSTVLYLYKEVLNTQKGSKVKIIIRHTKRLMMSYESAINALSEASDKFVTGPLEWLRKRKLIKQAKRKIAEMKSAVTRWVNSSLMDLCGD